MTKFLEPFLDQDFSRTVSIELFPIDTTFKNSSIQTQLCSVCKGLLTVTGIHVSLGQYSSSHFPVWQLAFFPPSLIFREEKKKTKIYPRQVKLLKLQTLLWSFWNSMCGIQVWQLCSSFPSWTQARWEEPSNVLKCWVAHSHKHTGTKLHHSKNRALQKCNFYLIWIPAPALPGIPDPGCLKERKSKTKVCTHHFVKCEVYMFNNEGQRCKNSLEFPVFDRGYESWIEQGDFSEFHSMNKSNLPVFVGTPWPHFCRSADWM